MIGANAVISIYYLVNGSKISNYPENPDITGIEAYIESIKSELVQVLGEQHNLETFDVYCDSITIKPGDKIVDDKGREYRVTGVERHQNNNDVDDVLKITANSKI